MKTLKYISALFLIVISVSCKTDGPVTPPDHIYKGTIEIPENTGDPVTSTLIVGDWEVFKFESKVIDITKAAGYSVDLTCLSSGSSFNSAILSFGSDNTVTSSGEIVVDFKSTTGNVDFLSDTETIKDALENATWSIVNNRLEIKSTENYFMIDGYGHTDNIAEFDENYFKSVDFNGATITLFIYGNGIRGGSTSEVGTKIVLKKL